MSSQSIFDTLHPGQKEVTRKVLSFTYPEIMVCCGRLYGKDFMVRTWLAKWIRDGYKIGVFCHVHKDAKKIMRAFQKMDKYHKYQYRKSSPLEIAYPQSSGYALFSSYENAENLRGDNEYDIIIVMEASLLSTPDYDQVVQPMTNSTKLTVYVGTAKPNKWFRDKFEAGQIPNPEVWSFRAPSSQNSKINTPTKLAKAKASLPPAIYRQEYECEFIDSAGSCFGDLGHVFTLTETPQPTKYTYHGVDVAQTTDFTVVVGLNENGHVYYLDSFNETTLPGIGDGSYYSEMDKRILQGIDRRGSYAVIEANGIGAATAQNIQQDAKYSDVTPVVSTNKIKTRAVQMLIAAIHRGEIKINPKMDGADELRTELEHFKYFISPNNPDVVVYRAEDGYHDDKVMALVWANFCRERNL